MGEGGGVFYLKFIIGSGYSKSKIISLKKTYRKEIRRTIYPLPNLK